MMHQDDRHDEFRPVMERLRSERPVATPLELDAIKQRVLARAPRPRSTTRRSFSLMRTRAAILSMLALGFLLSTTGAGLAVSGLADNNQASTGQYGPTPTPTSTSTSTPTPTPTSTSTSPPTTTTTTTPPATQPATTAPGAPAPQVTSTPAPESNVLGEQKENKPQSKPETQQPSQVLPAETQTPPAAVQPARQLEQGTTGNNLPFTGFAALPVLLAGLVLLTAGLVMRRSATKE